MNEGLNAAKGIMNGCLFSVVVGVIIILLVVIS